MNPMDSAMAVFAEQHGTDKIFRRWLLEKEVQDFLHLNVTGGIILVDVLTGHGMLDTISPQLLAACKNLMGDKIASADQINQMLVDRMMEGDASVLGFINKIKGQIGEDVFVDTANHAGLSAHLADLRNQEAWDVAVTSHDGVTEYIQVKTMASPDAVIEHMKSVAAKVAEGTIKDGANGATVHDISFAVPEDIFQAVHDKALAAGLATKVISFPLPAADAAQMVQDGFDNAAYLGLGNFFQQLAGGMLTATVLHSLVHAYLLHKGACKAENMLGEVSSKVALSGGGIAAGLGMESLLKGLGVATGSLPAVAVIMATSLSVRGLLRRIASRRDYEHWIAHDITMMRMQLLPSMEPLGHNP
jgi:hypothetical protein